VCECIAVEVKDGGRFAKMRWKKHLVADGGTTSVVIWWNGFEDHHQAECIRSAAQGQEK
jgi:hypothetical protein